MKQKINGLLGNKTLLVGVLLMCCLVAYGISAVVPESVKATAAAERKYVPSVVLSGEVIADTLVRVPSLTGGAIDEIPVKNGAAVQKGDILVRLNPAQAEIELAQSEAQRMAAAARLKQAVGVDLAKAQLDLLDAQHTYTLAKQEWTNQQALHNTGGVSEIDLMKSKQAFERAAQQMDGAEGTVRALSPGGASIQILQADVAARTADVKSKQLQLADCAVKAPVTGRVLEIPVQIGEMVTKGDTVAQIGQSTLTRIRVRPDQRFSYLASPGNPTAVWIPGQEKTKYQGQVVERDPSGDAQEGTRAAEIELTRNVDRLVPGTVISVQLMQRYPENAVILDDLWVTAVRDISGVWKLSEGKAHFVPVVLGGQTSQGIVIEKGVRAGEVILQPADYKEGQRVRAALPKGGQD